MAVRRKIGRNPMLNALIRWIERVMAPNADILARMPASAVRQALYSF